MRRRREPDPPALPPKLWGRWMLLGLRWQRALKRLWDYAGTHRGDFFWIDLAAVQEVAGIGAADWPAFAAMLDAYLVRGKDGRVIFKGMVWASRKLRLAVWMGSVGGNRRVLNEFLREQGGPAGPDVAAERLAALDWRIALLNEADREATRAESELRGEQPRKPEKYRHEHAPMNRVSRRLKGVMGWLGLAGLAEPPRRAMVILAALERRGRLELDGLLEALLLPADLFIARWTNRGPPGRPAAA